MTDERLKHLPELLNYLEAEKEKKLAQFKKNKLSNYNFYREELNQVCEEIEQCLRVKDDAWKVTLIPNDFNCSINFVRVIAPPSAAFPTYSTCFKREDEFVINLEYDLYVDKYKVSWGRGKYELITKRDDVVTEIVAALRWELTNQLENLKLK